MNVKTYIVKHAKGERKSRLTAAADTIVLEN